MATFDLEVVSARRLVWEGEAERLIVRTSEGDVGILAHHEPLIATLVPCVAEALAADGRAETFMVDGGFLSIADNRVSLLSQYVRLGHEISLDEAEHELAAAKKVVESGRADDETMHRYRRAQAQRQVAHRYHQLHDGV